MAHRHCRWAMVHHATEVVMLPCVCRPHLLVSLKFTRPLWGASPFRSPLAGSRCPAASGSPTPGVMVRVSRVVPGGIAEQLGIVPLTELLSVNGRELADFLDWEFLSADDELVIEARLPDGALVVYEIERSSEDIFGIELEPPRVRRCANRCEFCFIEGLPSGLRRNLYVRDDDYRLSFAYGNFATFSNVKERDIARILEYRLSPLYVSVHATPWEARRVLL